MTSTPALHFRISRDYGHLHCALHHLNLSTRNGGDHTVVKVCCSYFRDEVQKALENQFGGAFVAGHIRFQLPQVEAQVISSGGSMPDE